MREKESERVEGEMKKTKKSKRNIKRKKERRK